ncbi:MAG: hypothetical protein M1821_002591 [Bathelium mastoideum]|nr:MAG: hypothetical protein M1821_002591 [Bathelium mastoideum]
MATPVTTVFILPLKAGESLSEEAGSAGEIWSDVLSTLKGLLGCKGVAWGLQEDKERAMMLVDWTSREALERATTELQALQNRLSKIRSGPLVMFSVELDYNQKPPSSVLAKTSSPVTEVILHYFESPVGQDQREQISTDAATFVQNVYAEVPTIHSFASGWQLDGEAGVAHQSISDGGVTMFIKLVGWPSAEEHGKVRDTKSFQKQLPNLKQGAKVGEMKLVKFVQA